MREQCMKKNEVFNVNVQTQGNKESVELPWKCKTRGVFHLLVQVPGETGNAGKALSPHLCHVKLVKQN